MVEDIVKSAGLMCLGTRLKRISERLQSDTQTIFDEMDAQLQVSHAPLLMAIDVHGPLSVGEIAEAVGVSQPAVTRAINILVSDGVLRLVADDTDKRVRRFALSKKGVLLAARGREEIWPKVNASVARLCGEDGDLLLALLARIEDGLKDRPLGEWRANAEGGEVKS